MNVPKAFEIALSRMVRDHAGLDESVVLRPWQTPADDGAWSAESDRTFPAVEFRATSPSYDDNQSTLRVECSISIGEKADDDLDRAIIGDMYDRVFVAVKNLFKGFRTAVDTDEKTAFDATMTELTTTDNYQFGGFTFGDGQQPYEDRGVNVMTISLTVHYSTTEF